MIPILTPSNSSVHKLATHLYHKAQHAYHAYIYMSCNVLRQLADPAPVAELSKTDLDEPGGDMIQLHEHDCNTQ